MTTGRIVIISVPSGVGKDTIIDAWKKSNPLVERVVTYTTRQPRDGEVDGVDYHFVKKDTFFKMAKQGEFLEHKEVHDNHYGTPVMGVTEIVNAGKIAVLKIDIQGALTLMPKINGLISIFLMPPSMEELERRLKLRDTESASQIRTRIRNAKKEIAASVHYTATVVNDKVDRAVNEIEKLVSGAK